MDGSVTFGRLAANLIATNHNNMRTTGVGLFLTTGIANRYKNGAITSEEAVRQIQAVVNSFPDSHHLREISEALKGSSNLATTKFDGMIDKEFQVFGAIAAPAFTSLAGAATLATVSLLGPVFVRYLNDPDNILSGQFAPPRPDPIQHIGAVAMEQLDRFIIEEGSLVDIFNNAGIPALKDTIEMLGLGQANPLESLANSIDSALGQAIKSVVNASNGDVENALKELEESIYNRMDVLSASTEQIIAIVGESNRSEVLKKEIEELRRKEQYIHQEITGAITILDSFTSKVLGAEAARKVTGCINAAQTAMQLFSGFAVGSLGPLGFAGGMVSVFQNVFSLFSGAGPDPLVQRLDELEKKMDRMTKIMTDGFEHLDKRLIDVLHLSQTILQEVVFSRRAV
jgi:hypothetical protein